MSKRVFTKILALITIIAMVASMSVISVSAVISSNEDAANSVFCVVYCVPDSDNPQNYHYGIQGTGFLINENYVVTANHVTHPDTDDQAYLKSVLGDNWRSKYEIRIYYNSGSYVKATEVTGLSNADADITVLKLENTISGKTALSLHKNVEDEVARGDAVYAIGYAGTAREIEDMNTSTYSVSNVSVYNGTITKFSQVNGVNCLSHNCNADYGMSGGPIVDGEGAVVGIVMGYVESGSQRFDYAPLSDYLTDNLDALSIPYTAADGTTNVTTTAAEGEETTEETTEAEVSYDDLNLAIESAEAKEEADYSEDSYTALTDALDKAKEALNSEDQAEIDAAADELNDAIDNLEEKSSMSMGVIIGIVAAVVVIIALVVVIIVVSKKKGSKEEPAAPVKPVAPVAPPMAPQPNRPMNGAPAAPAAGFNNRPTGPSPVMPHNIPAANNKDDMATGILNNGAGETTVLNNGAGETTVLSAKPYAKLLRKSNNESIVVNAATFVIGKERRKVNYCIEDNKTISRSHAQIVKSGNKVAVVDLGSTNGTFVNGTKCAPNTNVFVNSGDVITLSDEAFTITIL